jgi:predicted GNAT family N-acyltransferase
LKPFHLTITDWQRDYVALTAVRVRVFVVEQGIPAEDEVDAIDASCIHLLATDVAGKPIGCGRLIDQVQWARIGRMAVRQEWRGSGLGRAIIERLVAVAQDNGFARVRLDAQSYAIPFYEKCGFIVFGDEHLDCGIPHREMERLLK